MYPKIMKTHSQSGNVLFYILIAVALLGGLSYAVSQSGRTGSAKGIQDDQAQLLASELLEYSDAISIAVSQLKLRGIDEDELCFDHPNWGAADYDHSPACTDDFNKIFHISGGGINWTNAPEMAMDLSATPDNLFHIYGDNEIEGVGTTCGAAGCSDLVLYVDELDDLVCQKLNTLLSITASDETPPTDAEISETRYVGSFAYNQTIGDEAGGAILEGQNAGCFQNLDNGEYVFYKVLLAR